AADARRAARARAAATTATGTGPVAAGGRGRSGAVCTAARRSVLPAVRLATAGEEGGATQERDQDPGKSSRRNKHWSGSLARRSGGVRGRVRVDHGHARPGSMRGAACSIGLFLLGWARDARRFRPEL